MKLISKFSNHQNIEYWRTYPRTNNTLCWSHLTMTCMCMRLGKTSRNTQGSQLTQGVQCKGGSCWSRCGNSSSAGWYVGGGSLLRRVTGCGGPQLLMFPLVLDPFIVGGLLGILGLVSIAGFTRCELSLYTEDL
jgi:hypothetical protein